QNVNSNLIAQRPTTLHLNGTNNSIIGTNNTITINQATLTNQGQLTIAGALDWQKGTLNGMGNTLVSGSLNLNNLSTKILDEQTLETSGIVTWNEGQIQGNNGGTWNNTINGTVNILGDILLSDGTGIKPVWTNAGTISKSGGERTSKIEAQFDNSGLVEIQVGTFQLTGEGTTTGQWNISNGATLEIDDDYIFTNNSNINGEGNLSLTDGFISVAGDYQITGNTVIDGAIVDFQNPSIPSLSINNGQADFISTTVNDLEITGGILDVEQTISIDNNWNWQGGIFQGNANVTGNLTLDKNTTKTLKEATLNTVDTLWLAGNIEANGATNWTSNGTLDILGENLSFIDGLGTKPIFTNTGTLRRASGNGVVEFASKFDNSNQVFIETGVFRLSGGGVSSGEYNIASGATFEIAGGSKNFSNTAQINGAGNALISGGTVTIDGNYNLTGEANISGGQISFNSDLAASKLTITGGNNSFNNNVTAPTILIAGNSRSDFNNPVSTTDLIVTGNSQTVFNDQLTATNLAMTGGEIYVSSPLNLSTVTLNGGYLDTSASLDINDLTWLEGELGGAGIITSDTSTIITSLGLKTLSGNLNNQGTITWLNGDILGQNGGTWTNANLLDIQGNQVSFTNDIGQMPVFTNTGTITRSSGLGVAEIGSTFDHSGVVNIETGVFRLSGGGVSSGEYNVNSESILDFAGGVHQLQLDSTIDGAGTV
ncbi:hypothetical protein, partial [Crocosphaera sp.]|uniref:beta strand repeat-containing protein n=1 Tax=Crocosphaera sp. TaxID=2729996 RepID=UPI00257C77AF